MSLLITCEVGGDAIPHWLVPHLQLIEHQTPDRRRKRKRSRSDQVKAKRTTSKNWRELSAQPQRISAQLSTAHEKAVDDSVEEQPTVSAVRQFTSESPARDDRKMDRADRDPSNAMSVRVNASSDPEAKILKRLKIDYHSFEISRKMAQTLNSHSCFNPFANELVDVTKDLKQRNLFNGPFRKFSRDVQQRLLSEIHQPYLELVSRAVETLLGENDFVIHFSVRTFPLRKKGLARRTDVGLLYDPSRSDEVDLCADLVDDMWYRAPMLKVRRNYPRRGPEVGITRQLRSRFAGRDYVGVELWLNRAWAGRRVGLREEAIAAMTDSIASVIGLDNIPLHDDMMIYEAA